MNRVSHTRKLTISGILLALYIVIMMATQGFAFGQYQVRIATALYGLAALFPFSVPVFGLANLISNMIMGGLGPIDAIGGCIVGLLSAGAAAWGKRMGLGNWIVIPIITFIPGLVVPLWLAYLLQVPYIILASSLLVGQVICGIVSYILVNAIERVRGTMNNETAPTQHDAMVMSSHEGVMATHDEFTSKEVRSYGKR
ncbi:QueT transporter family protein [Veillonella magna]|uniref:QueT transporter family protein n=1 Tax=Veillonella magna TaxID=464322 RepID=UPI0023F233C9|nr:QueT transporter family protein [Veillonella magna]